MLDAPGGIAYSHAPQYWQLTHKARGVGLT